KFDTAGDSKTTDINQSMYPSIRQLPMLGVGYADLFRNTKVQEAIFETLTQEYELAKVEEAKETPSVKVIDSPDIPDKKSFPPRLLIIVGGTCLSLGVAFVWVLGGAAWENIDPEDPRKMLAQEVFANAETKLWASSQNGDRRPTLKS